MTRTFKWQEISEDESLKADSQIFERMPSNPIHYFWMGFLLSTLSFVFMSVFKSDNKIYVYLQFLGDFLFIAAAVQLISFRFNNRIIAVVFLFLIIWIVSIIARGINFGKDYLINSIVDTYGGFLPYLAPFIMLFPKNLIYIKKLFNVIIMLGFFYILTILLTFTELTGAGTEWGQQIAEYSIKYMSLPLGFILLTNKYHSNRKLLFAFVIILITFVIAIIRARRGLIFMTFNAMMFSFIFYFLTNKGNLIKRFLPLIFLPLILVFLLNFYSENKSGLFSYMNERLEEDTRSEVVTFFILDMGFEDWMVGRGINGQYYCPVAEDTTSDYRNVIETDYLQIILKGGIIYLVLLLIITVPAAINGIFKSENMLSKAAGVWIIFWLIDLYPSSVTIFSLNYLMVWICVGICYSPVVRGLSDESICEFFLTSRTKLLI